MKYGATITPKRAIRESPLWVNILMRTSLNLVLFDLNINLLYGRYAKRCIVFMDPRGVFRVLSHAIASQHFVALCPRRRKQFTELFSSASLPPGSTPSIYIKTMHRKCGALFLWIRGESNPCPKTSQKSFLRAHLTFKILLLPSR